MKRNMYQWVDEMIAAPQKKPLPVLSFPSVQKLGIAVQALTRDSDLQAEGIRLIAENFDTAAAVSYMDLSLEAEAFGSEIRYSEGEVPTVVGSIVEDMEGAEALAGLLSGDLAEEFSAAYVRKLVAAVQDESFLVVYHNCGNSAISTVDTIVSNGCRMFHFGNAIDMAEMMPHIPENCIAMGNVDPARQFRNGTPESVYAATTAVMENCAKYPNFVISSGCDIPPMTDWENIRAFFRAVDDYYKKAGI